MIQTTHKPIIVLAVGSVIGAAAVILVGFVLTRLTYPQFQALQYWLTVLLNIGFVLYIILYAPLKTRALNRRIKKLEGLIRPPMVGGSGTAPTEQPR